MDSSAMDAFKFPADFTEFARQENFSLTKENDKFYNMNYKNTGICLIFAYESYQSSENEKRASAKIDTEMCKQSFGGIGFDVRKHMNATHDEFNKILREVQAEDHTNNGCLAVVFMSHGGLDDDGNQLLQLYDEEVPARWLFDPFKGGNCPTLIGKPKLFFIQACRGEEDDQGVQVKYTGGLQVETDGVVPPPPSYVIPSEADMLIMWASAPGKPAFRGYYDGLPQSIFIRYLAIVLLLQHRFKPLGEMLLEVTWHVATKYESDIKDARNKRFDRNKQVPQTVSTLLRQLKFYQTD